MIQLLVGYRNVKLGDLVIYRDNLMMTHAGVYDPSILQDEQQIGIYIQLQQWYIKYLMFHCKQLLVLEKVYLMQL